MGSIATPFENFIALSRYARWIESEERRETWTETVDRYVDFIVGHITENYSAPDAKLVEQIRTAIKDRQVMPSMRALMSAGPALARDHLAGYNCSFLAVDSPRAFDEAMYILMCGTGVGYSVEQKYVSLLPAVNEHFENSNSIIVVDDSKAGWARAFRELLALLWQGQVPTWDMSKVRPAGARLKTFGGRASGPEPLENLFKFAVKTFKAASGRQLTTLECHDLMCKVGEVVVVGGVRRSALISLSDLGDYDLAKAKSGTAWYETEKQRTLANNSAVYNSKPSVGHFLEEWGSIIESNSGERGLFNLEGNKKKAQSIGRDHTKLTGTNPCGEIILRSDELCNLTEVVIRADDDIMTITNKIRLATVLGTWQSTFTNFKYVRKIWKDNCEEERLLGVSLTGIFGNPITNGASGLDVLASNLTQFRKTAWEVNRKVAAGLGINPSAAITTIKPSGTVAQLCAVSSGIHPWHSDYYIRTVRADNKDPMTLFMKDAGIYSEPDITRPETGTVFYFPKKAPAGAVTRSQLSAIDHLSIWKIYKLYWTDHNPSVTINVKDDEWIEVAAWVYENWDDVGGISFLPYSDHIYKQAPYIDLTKNEYDEWVKKSPADIDWTAFPLYEIEDSTTGSQELACVAADGCDVVDITAAIETKSGTMAS